MKAYSPEVDEMAQDVQDFISDHLPVIFPEIKSGDVDPGESVKFERALLRFIDHWRINNS